MPTELPLTQLQSLLRELCRLPAETEWVEFKSNKDSAEMIGEYISALANSAALIGKQSAYVVWGVNDENHEVTGTTFKPSEMQHKQQELESWLLQKISPKIFFQFHEFLSTDHQPVVILEIQAASNTPVQFDGTEFIRIGSYKKKLRDHSERERALWRVFDKVPFEKQIAAENLVADDVLQYIDYPQYFELTNQPLPENKAAILNALDADKIITKGTNGLWGITNLGAILFAKKLKNFQHLGRKAVRLILYKGNSRVTTIREIEGAKGYAVGFENLIEYIKTLLPENEEIGKAFRKQVPMFPDLSIRELVANALIHQDFSITGTGPMIEIFESRMEITNPGIPLVATERFLDAPPQSRNEALASFMRRINICEERGTGIDKVITESELYQLPAPSFELSDHHTRVVLFGYKSFTDMDKEDRIRACYQHCCLRYVNREHMNNTSLRERLGIDIKNSAMVSRVIKDTLTADLIKPYDSDAGTKAMRYIPHWA
ncbi:ATP-binding protein [Acinetobacter pittii]|uniref:ATP-binding protein n=1 Tax=Acinetobacter calcoaceticus/baumannii complex TaxID=909768 RepID=UPI002030C5A1|nr:ATP-binding protein [Acinetobacter pittii]MCM1961823.1 putative DNA binding domain-containing protein [Acinetobacter pittii]MCM1978380.1 putative DNA binding domain-containing protein [Acinetobacter pittii]MDC4441464.1 putative DNA binding domain-containing protein [Acinetobacter baumannii]